MPLIKCLERHQPVGGRIIRFGLAVFVALVFLAGLSISLQASAPEPPKRQDIIVLLDNSGSMVRPYDTTAPQKIVVPYDAEQRRIVFARFLVRLLQTVSPIDKSVGAAVFAAEVTEAAGRTPSVIPLAPLTPVQNWTAADVAAVQQRECPPKNAANAQEAGRDFCYGTNYTAAFGWAKEQLLATSSCQKTGRRCDILLFTDGALGETNSDEVEAITATLQALQRDGIKTWVVVFEPPKQHPEDRARWNQWRGQWETWQAGSLVAGVATHSSEQPVSDLYDSALKFLGIDGLLADFRSVTVSRETATTEEPIRLAPDAASLRLVLLTGAAITATYSFSPTLEPTGGERWWIMPAFSDLTMNLTGAGLVYYRVSTTTMTSTVPVQASVAVLPAVQRAGGQVQIQAFVHAGRQVLNNPRDLQVKARIQPSGQEVGLMPQADGAWTAQVSGLATQRYTVTITAEPQGWRPVAPIQAVSATFEVRDALLSRAVLRVSPQVQVAGWPVEFEVAFFADDVVAQLPPGAQVQVRLAPGVGPVDLTPQPDGVWRATLPITRTGEFTVSAAVTSAEWQEQPAPKTLKVVSAPRLRVMTGPLKTADVLRVQAPISDSLFLVAELEGQEAGGRQYAVLPGQVIEIQGPPGASPWPSWIIVLIALALCMAVVIGWRRLEQWWVRRSQMKRAMNGDKEALRMIMSQADTGLQPSYLAKLAHKLAEAPSMQKARRRSS